MADAYATQIIENPLCDRLKVKFSGRGLSHVGAPAYNPNVKVERPVSKAEKFAREAANPFEETAVYENVGAATKKFDAVKTEAKKAKRNASVLTKEQVAKMRTQAFEKTTPFASGAYQVAYARAAQIRVAVVDNEVKMRNQAIKDRVVAKKSFDIRNIFEKSFWSHEDSSIGERKIKLPKMSKSLIIGIAIAVVILFVLIYSFSQITAIKNEISTLENTKQTLSADIDDLKLQIDLKNDVRVLEDQAEDIGMVKSNKVESKYVSLATGDHIEVVNDESSNTDTNYGIFSTMMSSVSANWDNLLDYFN